MNRLRHKAHKLTVVVLVCVGLYSALLPSSITQAAVPVPFPDCSMPAMLYGRCRFTGYFSGTEGELQSGDSSLIYPITPSYKYVDDSLYPTTATDRNWSFPAVPGCQATPVSTQTSGCIYNAGYAETFISILENYINGDYLCPQSPLVAPPVFDTGLTSTTTRCSLNRANALGAAMIINTMMNKPGTTYGTTNWEAACPPSAYPGGYPAANRAAYNACYDSQIKPMLIKGVEGLEGARKNFASWASLVRTYNTKGLVRWSEYKEYPPNHDNSTGMNWGTDIEFFQNAYESKDQFILFMDPNDPSKVVFGINRSCANILTAKEVPQISDPPLVCITVSPTAMVNQPVGFSANGGNGLYNWSGGGTPPSVAGPNFTTSFSTAGPKTVTVTSPGSTPSSAICSITIVPPPTKPSFKVVGGDVVAGSNFDNGGSACGGPNPNAGIFGFNDGPSGSPPNIGASTTLAAFAVNQIYGFASAAGRSNPSPPKGLSFSNTAGDVTFGGSFGDAPCATDYGNLLVSNGYSEDNTTSTINGLTVPNAPSVGSRRVIRINGNIIIRGNIIYSGSGGWLNISEIPSLYVIAYGGNIYIQPGVNRLDGVYIAQPNVATGVGGTIYTCANGPPPLFDASNLHANCNSSLEVNGSFIAKTIRLLRTRGNYLANTPAEVFNYTPELFLVPSPFTAGASYQSITNLPPVL